MNQVLSTCPVCSSSLTITELHCRTCDTTIKGQFQTGRLAQLTPEHLQFVETFLQCEGKIKAVEARLGISYPTVRARLREVIGAMGFEMSDEPIDEPDTVTIEQDRRRVLDDLAAGLITSDQAIGLLQREPI